MKIAQINSVLNSGSTGRIAEQIGEMAINAGHTSLVAFGRRANKSSSTAYKIGSRRDALWHGVESILFDRHGLASRVATKKLILHLTDARPDIVVLHNIHGYYLNYPILFDYLKSSGCPVVWTLHDCWPFTGHCAHFTRFDCMKWSTGCNNCPMTHYYPFSISDQSGRNFVLKKRYFSKLPNATIITPSNWLKSIVERSFLSEYPVRVINNGIDLDVFCPGPQKPRENIVLGVANEWTDNKGLHDFIEIRKSLPSKYKIVLIGIKKAQAKLLPNGIQGVAKTESAMELADWYQSAAVFVNPTYNDNFPTTNLEALACGTPVITYDTGGSPEAVDDETGRVVAQGDLKELARTIEAIVENGCESMRQACRRRAENRFRSSDRFAEYCRLFESLVGK